jgi:hypothetical protein
MRVQEQQRPVWWIYAPCADGTVTVSKAFLTGYDKYGETESRKVSRAEAEEMWEYGLQRGGVRELNPRVCADLYVCF